MIAILLPLALLQATPQPPEPRRQIPDPGVIASLQKVTPAGVQSVFNGRVTGVRFAPNSGELWVAVVGSAYHLAWADNRVLGRGAFNGPTGVQAVTIDPVKGRALVTSIGHLPITATEAQMPGTLPRLESRPGVQLSFFDDTARGAKISPRFTTGALGEYIVGAPAIASRPNATGHRVAVVPLTVEDRLTIVDADNGASLAAVPLGVAPIASALSADGSVAYVTNLGGDKPRSGERTATQCCHPRGEPVRIDARGIAERGSVMRVDVLAHKVTESIKVGRHPTALVWDTLRNRLYVADGNDDDVSVIDVPSNRVISKYETPFRERQIGAAPTALALTPDGRQLFVAFGGLNAVAVYDISAGVAQARFAGLIPTAWYPSSLDVSRDGRYLAIGALFGVGSGEGRTGGSPGKKGRYVFAERGSVNVVEIPTATQLAAYTAAVIANDHVSLSGGRPRDSTRLAATPRAVPELPGDSSLIKHVVYVIKENRTYDQILGDLGRGDSDSSLVIYGRDVTPNQHALAEQFVVLDRMFASGGNSADGHNWLTQANETEYAMWPLYLGRSYPSEGTDPLVYSSGGFLWESAQSKGKTVSVFGEYAPSASDSIPAVRSSLMAEYQANQQRGSGYFRDLLRKRYDTHSDIPSLDKILVREYPGWTQEVPDVVKAEVILDHLREWESERTMPDLVMVILPSDHTVGTSPGWCVPRACVADNDLALGKIVDGLTHSSFWKDMAILVIEDDAQNGVDHVDGHRTTAFAISPYVRRGSVDHTFYNQPSMVKTIELMLGLPALSLFDLVATDMRASFIRPGEQPNYAPFTAVPASQALDQVNARVSGIRGADAAARRGAALASLRMRFDGPDEAPSDALNRILWHDARGWNAPYPAVRQSLFFPMSRDIADDDREESRGQTVKRDR